MALMMANSLLTTEHPVNDQLCDWMMRVQDDWVNGILFKVTATAKVPSDSDDLTSVVKLWGKCSQLASSSHWFTCSKWKDSDWIHENSHGIRPQGDITDGECQLRLEDFS
ncbi:hypothetical protein SKAU_G00298630 [Synaphobranchus kaupii]|uniref:Uncharacterized protein n=1 Tax=Synaphobranchus kaupii TaxID=118154 RepID=A0A9Q1IKW7_SYNKA|nr:hypothetical protein SKAU_G00298630 [Synaphobranchus kaupii]